MGLLEVVHTLLVIFDITELTSFIALCLLAVFDHGEDHRGDEGGCECSEDEGNDARENGSCHKLTSFLCKKIIVIVGSEVGHSTCLATERLTGLDKLKVVKTAGDTLISIAIEAVEVDAGTTVYTGVHF